MDFTTRFQHLMQQSVVGASDTTHPLADVGALTKTAIGTARNILGSIESQLMQNGAVTALGLRQHGAYLRFFRSTNREWCRVVVRMRPAKNGLHMTLSLTRELERTKIEVGRQARTIPFETPALQKEVHQFIEDAFLTLYKELSNPA